MPITSANAIVLAALPSSRILVAEADNDHLQPIEDALTHHGAEVTVVRSLEEAHAELGRWREPFDAAVVALSLPGGTGASLVAELRRQDEPCLAVMLSPRRDARAVRELLEAGASELLFSPRPIAEVVSAVERTIEATRKLRLRLGLGEPQVTARDAPRVCRVLRMPVRRRAVRMPGPQPGMDVEEAVESLTRRIRLSPRQKAVLRFIALGYRYQEIGAELGISERTVKMHAANLRRKAGVSSRYELLRKMFAT